MLLIDLLRSLPYWIPWYVAIKNYQPTLLMNKKLIDKNFELDKQVIADNRTIQYLQIKVSQLEEQLRQCRLVFKIHRTAAESSILDAEKARLEYEKKAKQLESGNDRNTK